MQGLIVLGIFFLVVAVCFFIYSRQKIAFVLTDEFRDILHILNDTKESIFISGKAGTGKSSLLQYFTARTEKKYVILAPTGIAAMNVKGQTVHSFFKLPPRLIQVAQLKPEYAKNALYENLDMVIIDEVSMISANLMEAIDTALRLNRNRPDEPFGGLQMVFIGDLFQLPPVVKSDLQEYFDVTYGGNYFFDSPVFKEGFKYHRKELTHIFRQKDEKFKKVLNRIRVNEAKFEDFVLLNARHRDNVGDNNSSIFLTTTNKNVKKINKKNLENLPGKEFIFEAVLTGKIREEFEKLNEQLANKKISESEFEDEIEIKFPTNVFLKLKLGAQVMMIKNDSLKRWVNGTVGTISRLNAYDIWVEIDGHSYKMEQENWQEITYQYDAKRKEIKENILGTFTQFPIKLAWAMTIHKSQGKTFDKVVIDIGYGAFSHGQTYVALSRCKTLEGIVLNKEIRPSDVIVDDRVIDYYMGK
ncbi:ATP-dependent RecD-like DNA helicase [Emticicia sp. BO119]|uniref:ATP-dependent DNA helicase n=1 Tax=Emticicia sp. BO119 TaxID=2757768 RepID=UPI0015EFF592|nr:DEAD/DEAH box helicase [Emticicia sp. BO119]MBA4849406.1 AAA family ATPase [Emticicia sp. BO119]